MDEPIQKRTEQEVGDLLRQYLREIDVTIAKEFNDKDFWGFWVKFGDFPILLENQRGKTFFLVAFQITLPEGPDVEELNGYYNRSDAKFLYELTKAFTSPLTSFSRILDSGRVVGFTVSRYIYPFYFDFSVKDLDRAIQAIVSQGAIGIAFIKAYLGEEEQIGGTPPASVPQDK
jgi:hypothetical protein